MLDPFPSSQSFSLVSGSSAPGRRRPQVRLCADGALPALPGIISPLLAGIFAVLLPIALRALVKYQGAYSYSSLELVVLKRLYMLFIVSQVRLSLPLRNDAHRPTLLLNSMRQLFIFSILSVVLRASPALAP